MEVRERAAPAPARSRLWQAVAGAALLVVLAALVAILLTRGGGGGGAAADEPAAAQTSTAAEETIAPLPPTPTPTGPTEDVDELPPSLPEVALDAPAAVGNGIVATVASVEAIEGTGVGPGNIAGPALRVTVAIENGTPEAVSLDGVAVNLAYGADRTPASPLDDPSRRPFTGMVEPGGTGEGVYVFSVPTDGREVVTVEVGYQAGAPLLLFTGSAG